MTEQFKKHKTMEGINMNELILEKSNSLDESKFYEWLRQYVYENDIFYVHLNKSWSVSEHRYSLDYNVNHLINDENFDRYNYLEKKLDKYLCNKNIKVSDKSDLKFVRYSEKLAKNIKPSGGMIYIINGGLCSHSGFNYYTLEEINSFNVNKKAK